MHFARLLVILLVALISFYLFSPNLGLIGGKKLNFGLDLRGGASLTLQIDTDSYINEKIASTLEELSAFKDPKNIANWVYCVLIEMIQLGSTWIQTI